MNEQTQRTIEYISVEKLFPHPENPRKDLGDLSELAESIRAQGILQNLTVVSNHISHDEYARLLDLYGENQDDPYLRHMMNHAFDGYTVIIGHRRLEAARLAGIEMVPCVVANMTHQQQVTTMMCENVQRSDLSVYEQADGFQMMMNLGMTVESIATETGFSQSTVRRRIKMSELDSETLRRVSAERQITIGDVDRLAEIKDIRTRNQVLSTIGTSNFEHTLVCELRKQERAEKEAAARVYLEGKGGVEVPYSKFHGQDDYKYVGFTLLHLDGYQDKLDELVGGVNLFTFAINWETAYIALYKEETDDDDDNDDEEIDEEEMERDQRTSKLREAFAVARDLRDRFINEFSEAEAKRHLPMIVAWIADNIASSRIITDSSSLWEMLGATEKSADKVSGQSPYKTLLLCAYVVSNVNENLTLYNWNGQYNHQQSYSIARYQYLYDHLASIGYEISDEERALLDGTSDLYLKETEQ